MDRIGKAPFGNVRLFETLDLDHEEDNLHDPNAVRVLRRTGEQLGYLRSELAAEIVSKSNHGYRFVVFIKDLTGNERKDNRSASISWYYRPSRESRTARSRDT